MTIDHVEERSIDTDEAAPAADASAEHGGQEARRRRIVHLVVVGFALIAVVASGLYWWNSERHDAAEVAQAETRDGVLLAATSHIETMNTLDYKNVDEGLNAWSEVTTGTLHDRIAGTGKEDRQLLEDQKKVSEGKVVNAAVIDLDDDSATVIAAVEVTVHDDTKPDAEDSIKRNRFAADLVKVEGDWLLETLEQVAVSIS